MDDSKYPDGSNEPDEEYNNFASDNDNCTGDCSECGICADDFTISQEDDLDNAILNSSALTKNSNKENKFEYSDIHDDTKPASDKTTTKTKRLSFKEQWEEVDQLCPDCGSIKKPAKGLTKQNIKRLFSFKGTPTGWIIFFLMCAALFFANLSYSLMMAPINCSDVSNIVTDSRENINGNNQMPIISEQDYLENTNISTESCQSEDQNTSDDCLTQEYEEYIDYVNEKE